MSYKQYLRDPSTKIPNSTSQYRKNKKRRLGLPQNENAVEVGLGLGLLEGPIQNAPGLAIPCHVNNRPVPDNIGLGDSEPELSSDGSGSERDSPRPSSISSLESGEDSDLENRGYQYHPTVPDSDPDDNDEVQQDHQIDDDNDVDCTVTKAQAELLIMAYVLISGTSWTNLARLLELINILAPALSISKTKYHFFKNIPETPCIFHFVCNICQSYLGTEITQQCPVCNTDLDEQVLRKLNSYFLALPSKPQLQKIVENNNLNFVCPHDIGIGNTCCGVMTQELRSVHNNTLTLTWNTDGVPLFHSSKKSIWPILCSVNELSFKDREQNLVLCGLWFGENKPNMNSFLKPFVEELEELRTDGFDFVNRNGIMEKMYVNLGAGSLDSVARAMVQNISQFNGEFGCGFCENPGEVVPKGMGHTRVYIENVGNVRERTHARMMTQSRVATESGLTTNGVKGPSILATVGNFDMTRNFVVDYMHCALLGVGRQFARLWFDSTSHHEEFYLGARQDIINNKLLEIKPPKEIRRLPRTLGQMCYWKASEWRSFILFYSPVVLKGMLPVAHYNHWLLFVNGVYLLIKHHITIEDMKKAHLCFVKFVVMIPALYGKEHVSYNCHLLTHLKSTVENWGPLWCTSAFTFENANGKLKEMYRGTQAVLQQIGNNFILLKDVVCRGKVIMDGASPLCVSMFEKLTGQQCQQTLKRLGFGRELFSEGIGQEGLTRQESLVLAQFLEEPSKEHKTVKTYQRFTYKGKLYSSHRYSSQFGRNDSCTSIVHGNSVLFGRIKKLAVILNNCMCNSKNHHCEPGTFVFYEQFEVEHSRIIDPFVRFNLSSMFANINRIVNRDQVCRVSDLGSKCILINKVLVKLPQFEFD